MTVTVLYKGEVDDVVENVTRAMMTLGYSGDDSFQISFIQDNQKVVKIVWLDDETEVKISK